MKNLIFLVLLVPTLFFAQAEKSVVSNSAWLTNYEKALKNATKERKNVLVYFTGSDWCAPCKMLKKDLFESTEFKTISDSYVLLYIDIPMNKDLISAEQLQYNKGLSAKLNKRGAVPLLKILSPNGVELGSYSGYSMNGEVGYHLDLLKKHQAI